MYTLIIQNFDGMCRIPELVARAKELGQTAVAITDHGNMSGVYQLYKECKKQGIQPIYGIEFYHIVEGVDKRFHLIAWAKNMTGLKNLYKLHEISHKHKVQGRFGKTYPVIKYSDLFQNKEGIIISSACIGGHIPYMILHNQYNDLYNTVEMLQREFKGDFYIEMQANSIPEQELANKELMKLCNQYMISHIITSDTHYILREDAAIQEMLLCMQTKDKMDNPKRFKFSCKDFWLKSEQEMLDTVRGITKDEALMGILNTSEIEDKCSFEMELPKVEEALPKYSDDERSALRDLCNKGWRNKRHAKGKKELDRSNYELGIIENKGYSGYFLIVSDYINWAKENNIVVGGGRGSGVGSFIAYLTGMTTLNPLDHGLLFERFLNPERYTSPDLLQSRV